MDSSKQDVGQGSQEAGGGRCSWCGETFAADQAAAAARRLRTSELAPGTDGLVALVRDQQAEIDRLRQEEGPGYREFYALGCEHAARLKEAENTGYSAALDDVLAGKVEPDLAFRINEALSPFATKSPAGQPDDSDPARLAAAAFDGIARSDFGDAVKRAMSRLRAADLERSARLQRAATAAFSSIRAEAGSVSDWLREVLNPEADLPGEKPRAGHGSVADETPDTHRRICFEASSLSSGGWLVTSRSHPWFTHHVGASVGLAAGMAEAVTALEAFVPGKA